MKLQEARQKQEADFERRKRVEDEEKKQREQKSKQG